MTPATSWTTSRPSSGWPSSARTSARRSPRGCGSSPPTSAARASRPPHPRSDRAPPGQVRRAAAPAGSRSRRRTGNGVTTVVGMSDDNAGGWFPGGSRETTPLDLTQGPGPQPRDTHLVSGPTPQVVHDTVQVDRSVFNSDRVPSPAIATGDRAPDPHADTGSVDVSGV